MAKSKRQPSPKHFVGSSGSVWASNQMMIRHTYPHLYEIDNDASSDNDIKKLGACISDHVNYFMDTYSEEDVLKVEQKEGVHKDYELARITSLVNGLDGALDKYKSIVPDQQDDDVNMCVDKITACLEHAKSVQIDIKKCNGRKLVKMYKPLLEKCNSGPSLCQPFISQK